MWRWVTAALAAAVIVSAGCGGGEDEALPRLAAGERPGFGIQSPAPGRAVLRFVRAAQRGDAAVMWSLLSAPTRETMGGTLGVFRRGSAQEIHDDFVGFTRARVALSRRLDGRWGVGAVIGLWVEEEEEPEPTAYAAAVRREPRGWRIELGGVVIEKLEPDPADETDERPEIGAEAQTAGEVERMLAWLDGAPLDARKRHDMPFTAQIGGVPEQDLAPGEHSLVVFAATRDTAAAVAWPFLVEG